MSDVQLLLVQWKVMGPDRSNLYYIVSLMCSGCFVETYFIEDVPVYAVLLTMKVIFKPRKSIDKKNVAMKQQ